MFNIIEWDKVSTFGFDYKLSNCSIFPISYSTYTENELLPVIIQTLAIVQIIGQLSS